VVCVAIFMTFVFASSRSFAATKYDVNIGGVAAGAPLAPGGVVWFNGYSPGTIRITAGDTISWHLVGGVHTVTSADTLTNGSFAYDSSPLFTPAGALADMGPGKLLAPGSVYELDTSGLATGTYHYFCKIHPGMTGTLIVVAGVSTVTLSATAGWGDSVYAVQAFAPENMTVVQGTIVHWRLANPTEPHTITGPAPGGGLAWDSSPNFNPPGPPPVLVVPGATFNHTFNTAGTFTYLCKVHAYEVGSSWVGMVGTVIVDPSVADTVNTLSAVSYAALGVAVVALLVGIYALVRKRKP